MIRLNKSVELLEWGLGSKQGNQNWNKIGSGKIIQKPKINDGIAEIIVSVNGDFVKANLNDEYIKIAQLGEGLTANANQAGEVGMGRIKKIDKTNNQYLVTIELKGEAKFSN